MINFVIHTYIHALTHSESVADKSLISETLHTYINSINSYLNFVNAFTFKSKCRRAMLRHVWAVSTGVIPRSHRKPTPYLLLTVQKKGLDYAH
uniref:SFRICE_001962 n=1 Tax=Spodoptera frugiperda TaxID=7108 RepID=A0A2H1VIJ8_SPOFR